MWKMFILWWSCKTGNNFLCSINGGKKWLRPAVSSRSAYLHSFVQQQQPAMASPAASSTCDASSSITYIWFFFLLGVSALTLLLFNKSLTSIMMMFLLQNSYVRSRLAWMMLTTTREWWWKRNEQRTLWNLFRCVLARMNECLRVRRLHGDRSAVDWPSAIVFRLSRTHTQTRNKTNSAGKNHDILSNIAIEKCNWAWKMPRIQTFSYTSRSRRFWLHTKNTKFSHIQPAEWQSKNDVCFVQTEDGTREKKIDRNLCAVRH